MIFLPNEDYYKQVLAREGVKNTKYRNSILEIIEQSKIPLTADEIFLILKQKHGSIWLSTVYRTLEILNSKDLITKLTIMDDDKARYEINHKEHRHYVICVTCHKIITFSDCPVEKFEKTLKQKIDFNVIGHKLEIYGYCQDCKSVK